MRLRFEPDLDFQLQAVEAVCGLFRGQEVNQTEFTVTRGRFDSPEALAFDWNEFGVGNRLTLPDREILANLKDIQFRNGLAPSASLESGDFSVEMETGTGKTYVYLRTIFELNKRYGFTKFVIVVPSVAIKEGVYKSLQMTADHFRSLYSGTPFEYFLYDSQKLGQVRNFATSAHIQIMVVTVGAINKKDINKLYEDSEKTGGDKPIDLIRATRPILIVDEPQSVDGGLRGRGKEALGAMNPLCTLRYSATHSDKHHMVYRLDAVDAYERKLVKQIEVASAIVEDAYNRPYVRLISTSSKRKEVSAKIEIDLESAGRVRRTERIVRAGDELEHLTGRGVYRDCHIGEIRAGVGNAFVEIRVPGGEHFLREGEAWGDVDAASVQRQMIRRTISEHFDKEIRLKPQGIKVLSLFFVDEVERYRRYDEAGNAIKGEYARMFEKEYLSLSRQSYYRSLFQDSQGSASVEGVHGGYFSIDRRKMGGRTIDVFKNTGGNSAADNDTYNLIMKDKEKLLSLGEPLRFIFSHSALREGWDNPNVFQICALRDIRTERERRQTIGRGLRLCVDQSGERLRGYEVNTLTVIARESYETFAESLQREIEKDTGFRFRIVEPHHFAQIPIAEGHEMGALGIDRSRALYDHLRAAGYLDEDGRVQESLRHAIRDGSIALPEEFTAQREEIVAVLRKRAGRVKIRKADERHTVRPRQAVLDSAEFKALWDRIKHKTIYRVNFDNGDLIKQCVRALKKAPSIPKTRLQWRKADIAIGQAGVQATETAGAATVVINESETALPDLLTELQDRTNLTRRSIYRILVKSDRLTDFQRNPQQFIKTAAQAINGCKQQVLVDGIRYRRLGDESCYSQERFLRDELTRLPAEHA